MPKAGAVRFRGHIARSFQMCLLYRMKGNTILRKYREALSNNENENTLSSDGYTLATSLPPATEPLL